MARLGVCSLEVKRDETLVDLQEVNKRKKTGLV